MEFLHLDRDIAVIIKPSGSLSEERDGDSTTVPALIKKALCEKGIEAEVYTVHRLDRETGGIMVYALTSYSAAELSRQIAAGELKKQYTATVHGQLDSCGEMSDLLFYDRKKNKSFPTAKMRRGVKDARLSYELLSYNEEKNTSRVLVTLFTGRTHQIRVQFASRHYPLVGDRKYGAPKGGEFDLMSYSLTFSHPVTNEKLCFKL